MEATNIEALVVGRDRDAAETVAAALDAMTCEARVCADLPAERTFGAVILTPNSWPEARALLDALAAWGAPPACILAWPPERGPLGDTAPYAGFLVGCLRGPASLRAIHKRVFAAARLRERRAQRPSCRTLVVEDQPDEAHLLVRRLTRSGLVDADAISVVETLEGAARCIEASAFDLVLTDLSLPDARGLDCVHHLRELTDDIPIVVASAIDDDDLAAEALSAGAQEYLFKGDASGPRVRQVVQRALTRKDSETRWTRLAQEDPLTGLLNRRGFFSRLEQALAAPEGAKRCALGLIDLDDFKPINDTYGHAAGDEVLRVTARRLLDTVRDEDVVARLGGDEFAILLHDVDADVLDAIADRLHRALGVEVPFGRDLLPTSASLGWRLGLDRDSAEVEVARADEALYAAKRGNLGWARWNLGRRSLVSP